MSETALRILPHTEEGVAEGAHLITNGDLVAFPTETVYGLGADARNGRAVAAIYDTKGRPSFNPLIVHVADLSAAREIAEFSPQAHLLARLFWPGPLTLVLPLHEGHGLSSLVTAGLATVALRVPVHPAAQALLHAVGGPVAAPSANLSGRISPTTAAHVNKGLRGKSVGVLDAGPCTVGLESTIVAPGHPPRLLRAGGTPVEEIERALSMPLASAGEGISAPGQLSSHYAPAQKVRLNAAAPTSDEVFLGFGPMDATLNLSTAGDLSEAAANLFDYLHRLDEADAPIAVAPIPDKGLGRAINDRLRRAAAPRSSSGAPGV
ncbi:MAG: L-threonylcarbamoyladenylate synthase [Pseudomonadota bacterium]